MHPFGVTTFGRHQRAMKAAAQIGVLTKTATASLAMPRVPAGAIDQPPIPQFSSSHSVMGV